jgi:hypothetical protein
MRWKHFDNWLVKLVAVLIIAGGLWWMVFAVRWHYQTKATSWEYLPFVVSMLAIMFAMALLSLKATQGAASVVLPFAQLVVERFGGKKTTMTVTPPAPGETPAGTVEVKHTDETPAGGGPQ